jgi:hypothetical protein
MPFVHAEIGWALQNRGSVFPGNAGNNIHIYVLVGRYGSDCMIQTGSNEEGQQFVDALLVSKACCSRWEIGWALHTKSIGPESPGNFGNYSRLSEVPWFRLYDPNW